MNRTTTARYEAVRTRAVDSFIALLSRATVADYHAASAWYYEANAFAESLTSAADAIATAYGQGVPMGSDLLPRAGSTPAFFAWALRDNDSAPLQRLQVVKGWIDNGEPRERVYDIACSDGLAVVVPLRK